MKQAILLAAYGAGGVQGMQTLQMFERMVREVFPASSIRWAFTSMTMRNRLVTARKKTDSVTKALCRMGFEKYTHVVIQSLHMVPGQEYEAMLAEVREAVSCGAPSNISIGTPLLHSLEDIETAARAIASMGMLPEARLPAEAVLWVGHGAWHEGGGAYDRLTETVQELDGNIFVGSLSGAKHGVGAYLTLFKERGISRVWLMPLLSVVGKHAREDIAGDGHESWRSILEAGGVSCSGVLRGAIEYRGFADIWLAHLKEAVAQSA